MYRSNTNTNIYYDILYDCTTNYYDKPKKNYDFSSVSNTNNTSQVLDSGW